MERERENREGDFFYTLQLPPLNPGWTEHAMGQGGLWEEQELCSSVLGIPLLKQDMNSLSSTSPFPLKLPRFL